VKNGSAVIIAASRNTGKTTTVAHLVKRGWGFVTDETVRLAADRNEVGGFSKPLSIKPGGGMLVDHLVEGMVPPAADGFESFRFVSVGTMGASIAQGGRPELVILLRRQEDGHPGDGAKSRALHPADAVVALMQETLDAERFEWAALRLARLASDARCHEVVLGTPSQTTDLIEELFAQSPLEPFPVDVLGPSAAMAPGVVSVKIGDRVVVHHMGTGTIFALDAAASNVWEQLGGWRNHEIDVHGPVVGAFVVQLRTLGVFADGPTTSDTGAGQ